MLGKWLCCKARLLQAMATMKATNFRFDASTTQLLDDLRRKNNATTKSEVVRKALALLEVASEARINGDKILIKSRDGHSERELILW